MIRENTDKNEHGANGINSLEKMIETLKSKDYIVMSQKKYRIGDPDYEEEQFYFQFLIEFNDHEQWILHHTTSIRDRITEQQWNSEHIKRLNAYVKKAYVVVPDGMDQKEKSNAQNYNDKIINHKIFSALDGVVPFEVMYQMIEHKGASLLESGVAKARLGLHFEEKLVDALNNKQNLEKWKDKTSTSVGYLYSLFKDVMNALKLSSKNVDYIFATSDIPKLPSGGTPKTDVLVQIKMLDGANLDYTFSCKRSTSDKVSVHEYTADAFAKVLNPSDGELRNLLIDFQTVGGIKSMDPDKAKALEERLALYGNKLSKWVLGGVGGEGDPKTQWAEYIIALDDNVGKYSIKSLDEYVLEYKSLGIIGQFGTPFQWTYPSGGKGKRIQLKGKMI